MKISITNLERKIPEDYVIKCFWVAALTDSEYASSTGGCVEFEFNPLKPGFVPYEELTEGIVVGWVLDAVGEQTKGFLEFEIAKQKNPVIAMGLPWVHDEEQL